MNENILKKGWVKVLSVLIAMALVLPMVFSLGQSKAEAAITGPDQSPVILQFEGVDADGNETDAVTGQFELTVWDENSNPWSNQKLYLYERNNWNAEWQYQDEIPGWYTLDDNGHTTFRNANTGHAWALKIPEGYRYEITYSGGGTLVGINDTDVTDGSDDDKMVSGTITSTVGMGKTISFKARPQDGAVKVMNFVAGETDSSADFTFNVEADKDFTSGAWTKYDAEGNAIESSTDDNAFSGNTASFTLKSGEYIVIQGLPFGTKYTVKGDPADGYIQASAINDDTEVYVAGQTRTTKIFNTPETEFSPAADPKDDDLNFEHHKRLDSLSDGVENEDTTLTGEDFSRLYLDMTGYQKAMDILFIVDRSNSMAYYTADGRRVADIAGGGVSEEDYTRQDNVLEYLYGDPNVADDGFFAEFLKKNPNNNVGVAYFGGLSNYVTYQELPEIYGGSPSKQIDRPSGALERDYFGQGQEVRYDYSHTLYGTVDGQGLDKGQNAGIAANWTSGADYAAGGTEVDDTEENRSNLYGNMFATDYISGLYQGLYMLSDEAIQTNGNDKVIVFLTDGAPTMWVSPDRAGTGRGDLSNPGDWAWKFYSDISEYGKVTPSTYADYLAWREAYEVDPLQTSARLFAYGRGSEVRSGEISNADVRFPGYENFFPASMATNADAMMFAGKHTAASEQNLEIGTIQKLLLPSIMDVRETVYGWDEQYGRTNQTQMYAIGFGTREEDTEFLNNLSPSNKDAEGNGKAFSAQSAQELTDTLNSILYQFPQDVTITDNLSKYVKFYDAQPDVKIVMEQLDKDGNLTGEKYVLYENGALTEYGSTGSYITALTPDTADHNPILDVNNPWTFTPTAGHTADYPYGSTGTFNLNFDDNYTMSNEWRYTVSFNVETSKTAYKEHDENGSKYLARNASGQYVTLATDENGNILDADGNIVTDQSQAQVLAENVTKEQATVILGQADTDYLPTDNKTSSGQPGFYANDSAEVSYKLRADGQTKSESYALPVVQVTEKKVNGTSHTNLGSKDEHFTYTITEQIGKGAVNVKLEDELDEILELIDPDTKVKVTDEKGKALSFTKNIEEADSSDVDKYGKIQKLTITVDDAEFEQSSRVITFSFTARVKPDLPNSVLSDHYKTVTDHNGTHSGIPNKATLTVNDAPHVTSEVTVTPPPFEPEKRINGDVHVNLVNREEVFHYTVDMLIPDDARTVAFSDSLDNVLAFDGTNATVTVHNGDNDGAGLVIKTVTLPTDSKILEFTFSEDELKEARGKIVTVAFDAKFDIDNVTDDDIKASYKSVSDNRTVKTDIDEHTGTPNEADFIINGGSHDTNIVTVVPPIPVKEVNKATHWDLTNRDEIFTYTVTQNFHEDAVKVEMTDTLKDVLTFVKSEFNGSEVDAYAVDENGQAVELESVEISKDNNDIENITVKVKDTDGKSVAAGKTVTFTFNAKIKDTATKEQLAQYIADGEETSNVPNMATVKVNEVPHTTNDVTVTPPNPGTLIIEKIEAGKEEDAESKEFTFEVVFTKAKGDDATEYVDPMTIADLKITEMDKAVAAADIVTKTKGTGDDAYTVLVVKAKDGAITKIEGIPANFNYEVTELPVVGYKNTHQTDATGIIAADKEIEAEFTNEPSSHENPEKFVNGIKAPAVNLGAREEIFTYTVKQIVPAATTKMVITDKLEDVLELVDANDNPLPSDTAYPIDGTAIGIKLEGQLSDTSIVDITAMDRSDGATDPATNEPLKIGTIELTEADGRQMITATLEDESGNDDFYEVTLTFRAKIKDGITDEELIERNEGTDAEGTNDVPNKAEVSVNNEAAVETNTVWVTPPEPATLRIIKIEKGKETAAKATEFTFEVTLTDNDGNHVDPDTLESLHINGKKLGSKGQSAVVEGEEGAKILVVKAKDGADAKITGIPAGYGYNVKERISEAAGFRQTHELNNSGIIEAGKVEQVTYANEPVPVETPEKKVNGVDEYTLATRPEEFTYTVTQIVPENAATIDFEDELEWVLKYTEGSLALTAEGQDEALELSDTKVEDIVADSKTQGKKPAQKITATYVPEGGLADLEGKTVTFTFKATIDTKVTDSVLIAEYGRDMKVPNEAVVAVDGRPQTTNTVYVEPPKDPEKFINGIKNDKETPVELVTRPTEFIYTVTQKIPPFAADATNYEVIFSDTVKDELEIVEDATLDIEDGDKWTAIVSDDKKTVTATIKDARELVGETVTLSFKAKIRDDVTDKELLDKYKNEAGEISIPNEATVTIGDNPEMKTNEVFVTPPPEEPEEPQKMIQADHEAAAHKGLATLDIRSEEFTYTVSQLMPGDAVSAKFEDTVDDLLEVIQDSASIDVDGAQPAINGQVVSATLTKEQAIASRGKVVTLTFKAKIKAGVTDEQIVAANKVRENAADYGEDVVVPNKATVTVNDDPKTTNEVLVTPPNDQEKPEKTVNGIKNDAESAVALEARSSTFEYAVSQKLPANAAKASFTDVLEPVLEYLADSGKLVLVDNSGDEAVETPVTAEVKYDKDKNTVSVTDLDVKGLDGKTIKLVFMAKIKDGVTDRELLEEYGSTTVPNDAVVSIDGHPNPTNTVYVEPPAEREEPEKTVEGKKYGVDDKADVDENGNKLGAYALSARDKEFTYRISQVIPANSKSATWTDELEDVLEVVSYELTDDKDTKIDAASVRESRGIVTATLRDEVLKSQWTKTVTLKIVAKIKGDVTDEQLLAKYNNTLDIPNKADVDIDNDSKTTNEVLVTPPPTEEEPEKFINGKKHGTDAAATDPTLQIDRNKEFTYTVEQLIPAGAVKASFEDELVDALTVVKADLDGKAATVTGNNVSAELTGDALKAKWGKKVTLTIVAKIKPASEISDADLLAKYENGNLDIPNTADVIIDDNKKTTNEVKVTPPSTEEEPEKKVNGKKHGTDAAATDPTLQIDRDKEFLYTVEQYIPVGASRATFEDELVDALTVVKADLEGVDASIKDNKVTAEIAGEALKAKWGKKVTLTIVAKIKPASEISDADLLAKYENGNLDIPNTADVTIDDNKKTTNEVKVTPPPVTPDPVGSVRVEHITEDGKVLKDWADVQKDQPADTPYTTNKETFPGYEFVKMDPDSAEAEGKVIADKTLDVIYVYKPIETEPEKFINGIKDADTTTVDVINPVQLAEREEIFTYTVSQLIPGGAVNVVFTDTLEDVLEVVGKPAIDAQGAEIKVDGQTVTATFADAAELAGRNVTLTINAKIKNGITDAQLIEKYGTTNVPNKATVTIDGKGKTTNEVLVTPPDEKEPPTPNEPPITKRVETSKAKMNDRHGDLATIDEVYSYEITTKIPTNAKGFELTDTIDDVLAFAGTESDVEVKLDGEKVTGAVKIDKQILTVTFTEEQVTAKADKDVVITFKAKINVSDEELVKKYADRTVPNTAEYTITNLKGEKGTPKPSNEVTVTPPAPTPTPDPVGSVRVEHITEDGKVLKDWADVQKDQPADTPYTTNKETFPGYEFVKMDPDSAEAEGKVIADKTLDVIYVYKPIETEPEKFINGIKDADTKTADVIDPVQLAQRDEVFTYTVSQIIPGGAVNVVFTDTLEDVLEVVGKPAIDAQGAEVKVDGQTVTATFADAAELAGRNVTLTINAKIKNGITDAQLIEKYATTNVPNKATVTIDGKGKTTNEVLVTPPDEIKAPAGSVRVKHITIDGTILHDWEMVEENVPGGTNYTTEKETFTGYTFVKMDDTSAAANGVVVNDKILDVIYVYAPVGSVIVRHIDTEGNVLKDWQDVLKDRPGGTAYTTSQETFEGYTYLKIDEGSAAPNGVVISGETLEVTYVYNRNGSVRVQHIDTDGNVLKDWEFVQENQPGGTAYTTAKETFEGYTFLKLDDASAGASGVVINNTTLDVIYVYTKEVVPEPETGSVIVRYITKDGTVLEGWTDVQRNQPAGTEYTTIQKEFDGYIFVEVPDYSAETDGTVEAGKTLEVTYVYQPVGSVIVRYITTDGTVLEDWTDVQRNQPAGTEYTTIQIEFAGYMFVEVPDYSAETDGTVEAGKTLEVTYVYKPLPEVEISKIDATTQRELPGASLTLRDSKGEIVDKWTSSDEKHIVKLAPGTYTLIEDSAPVGYNTAEPVVFDVTLDGVTEPVVMVDTSDTTKDQFDIDVSVEKKWSDYNGKEVGWPANVEKIAFKLQYFDAVNGWTDYMPFGTPVTVEIGAGELGAFTNLPAKISGVTAKYRAVELTNIEGYGIAISSETDLEAYNGLMVATNKPDRPGDFNITFTKAALGGKELAGAKMVLKDSEGNEIERWTSATEAYELSLPKGEYIIIEEAAPEGYQRVTTEIAFTVDEYGKVTLKSATVDNGGKISVLDGTHIVLEDAPVEKTDDRTNPKPPTSIPGSPDKTETTVVPSNPGTPSTPVTTRRVATPTSNISNPVTSKATSTGDANSSLAWIALAAASAAALAAMAVVMTRRRRKNN